MLLAGDRLTSRSASIAIVSRAIGYESEAAFSTAFSKAMSRTSTNGQPKMGQSGQRTADQSLDDIDRS